MKWSWANVQEELKTDSVWNFKDVLYEADFAFYGK